MFWRNIDFWDYGPNHGLIVIDMQETPLKIGKSHFWKTIQSLIDRIGNEVKKCNDMWGEIILIEYVQGGRTIPEIRQQAESSYGISKDSSDILEPPRNPAIYPYGRYYLPNVQFFNKRTDKSYTISGINASRCVAQSASSLSQIVNIRVHAGLTMNCSNPEDGQFIESIPFPRELLYIPAEYTHVKKFTEWLRIQIPLSSH